QLRSPATVTTTDGWACGHGATIRFRFVALLWVGPARRRQRKQPWKWNETSPTNHVSFRPKLSRNHNLHNHFRYGWASGQLQPADSSSLFVADSLAPSAGQAAV